MLTQFNASLSLIPDNEYFGMIETYIGKVPTPFHKPQLHHTLATFFANDDVVHKIIERIDELDAILISALYICESLSEEQLCVMFQETHTYTIVMERVINLEERLIFLPFPNEKNQICINPILKNVLKKQVISTLSLFESTSEARYSVTYQLYYYIQSLASFAIHIAKEKKRKEKWLMLTQLFSNMYSNECDEEKWQKVLVDDINVLVDTNKVNSLLSKSPTEVMYYFISKLSHSETLPFIVLEENEDIFRFLSFIEYRLLHLDITSVTSFKRLIYIASFLHHIKITDLEKTCSLLHFLGIIPIDNNNRTIDMAAYGIIDSDFSITFHPSVSYYTPNNIHYYAQISSYDNAIMYVINKMSVTRAFDHHFSVEDILNDISSWSKMSSQLLQQQLQFMYHEYEQIQIYDGISVCVSDRLEQIIDNYEPLYPFIVKKIAKKVYLFHRDNEKKWREELTKIGLATLPSTITQLPNSDNKGDENIESFLDIESSFTSIMDEIFLLDNTNKDTLVIGDNSIKGLKNEVTRLFPTGTVRDELMAKVDQKIIIMPSQIKAPSKRNAHISASGFDFNKKLLVIKTAMDHKSLLLDIRCLNEDGELDSIIGHPVAYTGKDNNGSVIIKTIPENKEKVIHIQKIFLIKTIKRSVFFKI